MITESITLVGSKRQEGISSFVMDRTLILFKISALYKSFTNLLT